MKFFSYIVIIFLFISCSPNPQEKLHSFEGFTMGTTYSIKIVKSDKSGFDYLLIKPSVDSILSEVNRQMSTYIEDSEISLFNKKRDSEWINVSEDLATVLNEALLISRESDGAFDITVGPLVNLWGFGPGRKKYEVPDESLVEEAKSKTGYQKYEVNLKNNLIRKTEPGLYCDLSAIAKGFGVDKVGLYFESLGIENYMVEIGGEVRTRGKNHKDELWKIGISTPDSETGIQKVVSLSGLSMATSGDYRNYFEEDNVRYSHTIDPRTGKPISHKLASVTIIDNNCMDADAIATAIDVLGPEKGMELANRLKIAVYMIVRENDGFIERMNKDFEKYLVN